ncbi:MBL fold metallo-hydrolase [Sciscionella marina]|uniref:MBL fold metallo-hydrolase n=1 Tax=Sciscionella marina TaxID=508770 RepID=UPI00037D32F9|nr:MBL fold metallo-hydrolase [Sciscionella marina]
MSPGIHRIPLPVPDPGLHAVNVYAIEDDAGITLIDGGWAGQESEEALDLALRKLGRKLDDVRRVLVTHAHHDHYTLALSLRERFGARVLLGEHERPTVLAGFRSGPLAQEGLLRRCGASGMVVEFARALRDQELPAELVRWAEPDEWLSDGERIRVGEYMLDVLETPGHTRGHLVFQIAEAGLLFSGDHVLPRITPSIGFERAPEPLPVSSFLDSLRRIRTLPNLTMLPAHGPVDTGVHRRVDELLVHHGDRLAAVRGLVGAGEETALAVAGALRWTRRDLPLDELDLVHRGLAVLETGAHLDLLVGDGMLTGSTDSGGTFRYWPSSAAQR